MRQALRNWGTRRSRRRSWAACLAQLEEFRGLAPRVLRAIAEEVEEESFPPDAFLCRPEARTNAMFVIRSGSARVFLDLGSGPLFIREVGPGDSFERSSLIGAPTIASVQAAQPTHALKLSRVGFDRAAQRFPAIRKRLEEFLGGSADLPPDP